MKWEFNSQVVVTTDPECMDRDAIFDYLHNTAYWCKGIPYDTCMKSLDHSVPFSLLVDDELAGFGRLVTDYATFSYLGDVFVLEEYRGKGYGKFLVQCINEWIDKHKLRTSLLLTSDAQSLYAAYSWVHPSDVRRVMRYKEPKRDFYS